MFYQKRGLPAESEIVICTVSKIQYHSIFVTLDEYNKKSAMLHISEVSPGRIRNIKDYVREGKVIVCKVLRVDQAKSNIDVSLRRVNDRERREKQDLVKQEQRAEKIVEFVAKETKQDARKLYDKILAIFEKDYDYLHEIFNDYVNNELSLSDFDLDEKTSSVLDEVIKLRIKPPEVTIKAKVHIECYSSNGLVIVKDVLNSILEISSEHIAINYLGGGNYSVNFVGKVYAEIEAPYNKMVEILEKQDKDFVYKLQRL